LDDFVNNCGIIFETGANHEIFAHGCEQVQVENCLIECYKSLVAVLQRDSFGPVAVRSDMTRKEFERLRMSIEEEDFFGVYSDPIEYGIQRTAFEKRKFQKLIAAARGVNLRTTRAKAEQWQRQLEKAQHSYERFKGLQKEIAAAKIRVDHQSIPVANARR
jgi:hypothetical protein